MKHIGTHRRCVKRLPAETSREGKYRVFSPIAMLNVNRSDNKYLEDLDACLTRVDHLLNKDGRRRNTSRILCEAKPFSQVRRFVYAEADNPKLYAAVTNLFELLEQRERKAMRHCPWNAPEKPFKEHDHED